jgi:hypothetical protein
MEKYQPMSGYNMQMPYTTPTSTSAAMPKPMTSAMPSSYAQPINVHASYEEINIYEQKKPQIHHQASQAHCHTPGGWSAAGSILVLYILLVIILRSNWK